MHFVRRYRAYLKDNPQGYWFKSKVYGFGWVPVRWQGWAILIAYVSGFTVILISFLSLKSPSNRDTLCFIIEAFTLAASFMLVCYVTGEKLKWQWGIPKKKK